MIINFQDFLKNYQDIQNKIIQDKYFFYVWKKNEIPTSFGKQKSFLEYEIQNKNTNFAQNQKKEFDKKQEYWLLNRIDNETSWFLYFAKNKEIYANYKKLQKENQIIKTYYAVVKWEFKKEKIFLTNPIMHKNKTKMIVINKKTDIKKWKWKKHYVNTEITKLFYDKQNNKTYLKAKIEKWIRHQIRIHLANEECPIIWDNIYNKEYIKFNQKLQLFSVWFKFKKRNF